jgi:hypothetical protein
MRGIGSRRRLAQPRVIRYRASRRIARRPCATQYAAGPEGAQGTPSSERRVGAGRRMPAQSPTDGTPTTRTTRHAAGRATRRSSSAVVPTPASWRRTSARLSGLHSSDQPRKRLSGWSPTSGRARAARWFCAVTPRRRPVGRRWSGHSPPAPTLRFDDGTIARGRTDASHDQFALTGRVFRERR